MAAPRAKMPAADIIEQLAADLHSLAFDLREPRTSIAQAERVIGEAERIASAVRSTVRGS